MYIEGDVAQLVTLNNDNILEVTYFDDTLV